MGTFENHFHKQETGENALSPPWLISRFAADTVSGCPPFASLPLIGGSNGAMYLYNVR